MGNGWQRQRLGVGTPEIFDPVTGDVQTTVVASRANERTNVTLGLGPGQSLFILIDDTTDTDSLATIRKDGTILYDNQPYKAFSLSPFSNVSANFTIPFWAKPEIAQVGTTGYVFYPYNPAVAYGSGHAACSIAIGWNGIELGEATTAGPVTVFSRTMAAK